MQTTSALYKQIVSGRHWFNTKITIAGNTLLETQIKEIEAERPGINAEIPSVGGALSATLQMTVINPSFTIPTRAEIVVYYRACNETQSSEWLDYGTFYIDTRETSANYNAVQTVAITAFDSMIKTEADYPDTDHDWPYLDKLVVAEIAQAIGIEVDSRTYGSMTVDYMVNPPTGEVMREVLEHIAAANCGNFVITAENKLLFVPLIGLDPEQNLVGRYLTPEGSTDALTFGDEGWYILV